MSQIDSKALLARFFDYVKIPSETGSEGAMAQQLMADCQALGLEVSRDDVTQAAQTDGFNLYVTLPGNAEGDPLLFSAHMDTVVPGQGIQPRLCDDGYIRAGGDTILGGDDKAGICAILEAMAAARNLPHRRVEAVFTVREESGMFGAKNLDYSRLQAKQGIVLDSSGPPSQIVTGAPSQNKISATILGRTAHAGLAPETGISAIQVAAHAVAAMELLRIDEETTCNIGTFQASGPTNIVAPQAELILEVRSRNTEKLNAHTQHLVDCLQSACQRFGAQLEYQVNTSYLGYQHGEDHPLVRQACNVAKTMGLTPKLTTSGGGSDANIFNEHGIAALNLGVGMEKVHTTEEQLCLAHMVGAAQMCLELMKA